MCIATRLMRSNMFCLGKASNMSLLTGLLFFADPGYAQSLSCATVPADKSINNVEIGKVWTGVGTSIGAATTQDGVLLAAYYDPERFVTLASFDPRNRQLCHKRLNSKFGGWDAHNALTMAISPDGIVHVIGNMHASPMVYARGPAKDLDQVTLASMTGEDEEASTYPRFLRGDDGNLLFLYRSGRSGDGTWLLNKWHDSRWERLTALFASQDEKGPVSAYPSDFVEDAQGRFHVAIVWRRTSDVASNFAVTYASTRDFQSWRVGDRAVNSPLSPNGMEMIDQPGEQHGLVNNVRLAMSRAGQPIVLFTKYSGDGRNAIFAANRTDQGWEVKEIAVADSRREIVGGGSIPDLPYGAFEGFASSGSAMRVRAVPAPNAQRILWLDPATLQSLKGQQQPAAHSSKPGASPMALPQGLADVTRWTEIIKQNGVDGTVKGQLRWFAQKANQDHPQNCTPQKPLACNPPPSPLIWSPN